MSAAGLALAPLQAELLSWAACWSLSFSGTILGWSTSSLGRVAGVLAPVEHSLVSHVCGLSKEAVGGCPRGAAPRAGYRRARSRGCLCLRQVDLGFSREEVEWRSEKSSLLKKIMVGS